MFKTTHMVTIVLPSLSIYPMSEMPPYLVSISQSWLRCPFSQSTYILVCMRSLTELMWWIGLCEMTPDMIYWPFLVRLLYMIPLVQSSYLSLICPLLKLLCSAWVSNLVPQFSLPTHPSCPLLKLLCRDECLIWFSNSVCLLLHHAHYWSYL